MRLTTTSAGAQKKQTVILGMEHDLNQLGNNSICNYELMLQPQITYQSNKKIPYWQNILKVCFSTSMHSKLPCVIRSKQRRLTRMRTNIFEEKAKLDRFEREQKIDEGDESVMMSETSNQSMGVWR